MKITELRKIVKESVQEAIREELKDILLEAIKSPKQTVNESYTPPVDNTNPYPMQVDSHPPSTSKLDMKENLRSSYVNAMGGDPFTTNQVQPPLAITTLDTTSPNGKLPEGDVSMNQIMNLMNTK